MKISSEAKVGLIGIVTIVVLIWGINYLKGRNILKGSYTLYTFYQEAGGLEDSSPVLLNGVKVGFVDQIILRAGENPPVKMVLQIEKQFPIAKDSYAEQFSVDLLGSKAIRILPSGNKQTLNHLDTILPSIAQDLLASFQTRLFPVFEEIGSLAGSLDTLARRLDTLISQEALSESLDNISHITTSLKAALIPGGSLDHSFTNLESFTAMLREQEEKMDALIGSLNGVVADLDNAGLDKLAAEFHEVASHFNLLLDQVNAGEGSAGKFFHSDSLYQNLNRLVSDMDILVRDLNENPEDYVQVSVFGKSRKEKSQK